MGRKPKYKTPEEAEESKKKSNKISREKYNNAQKEILDSNPELKKEAIQKQMIANAKYLAKIPPEKKRKNWARQKRNWKTKNKIKVNVISTKTEILPQIKLLQLQVSCEQAQENEQ